MADISLKQVIKRFGDVQTIHGVDLEIENGEFVVFVGPSGCGKSTLLRLVAGLEEISDGEIHIDNQLVNDIDPAERGVAMVFQSYALYPHMTVEENMGFGLKMNGLPKEQIEKQVHSAAKTLKLDHLLKRKPKELSGGQRQRVAIGRAIVRNPKVFLFDEPLSNLDAELRVDMRLQIAKLHQDLQNTMIYVTHDQIEAMTLADKIVVLRDGRVEQVGSPLELYHNPQNEFVAGFIGSPKMNFIPTKIESSNEQELKLVSEDGSLFTLPAVQQDLAAGDSLTLGIRPEHLEIDLSGDVHLNFQSEVVERLGNSTYMFGQSCGVDGFKVHLPGDQEVSKFQQMELSCKASDCHLFDANGLRVE
ncbi:sn-glycerol-3-phosphate ABC transporter ATP-binding protein UgpC [Vibrio europaeus]|uniref:Sn-glycerol-3-phosphate ABC transporter ATP-binding protein UgpC n=1 Tax=Vibrio europaeus TaxID=300876 RepID=A0AAE7ARA6_9VIBR|nr:sn-glycerol-3-phosphate ABC transporter ATP-binding protein UgpC [Vibrio europaeus]MDC5803911.1 sn-glycerol-3-phosphate ABC transporter ATP-binding protein UgpC [Vibrio europaeus]MDC5810191.1 sn-glycerol-3-phosphate ABC transporter ATP-binding protein UgpC [Vibrio europaeus]MDC5823784.1 sn-glycerol-3-phosphate ABC transporter ATP-binding protein UgpC [Vibrio europaeus]MDC5828380.1 sn-glycerol-3-phosphate ABC transporter ATP-binding protein UgpC [Vibrio europaeus]MDC5833516.1 sn-glycerol-3-p